LLSGFLVKKTSGNYKYFVALYIFGTLLVIASSTQNLDKYHVLS